MQEESKHGLPNAEKEGNGLFIADLHIHSKYSRATSRDCDAPHLDLWAGKKGIALVGTGDFTHPAWRQELEELLEPANYAGSSAAFVDRAMERWGDVG